MTDLEVATSHFSHRDLSFATKNAIKEVLGQLSRSPDLILFFPGCYGEEKQQYLESLDILHSYTGDTPMVGCSSVGSFTGDDYSIKGVGIAAIGGIKASTFLTPRSRVRGRKKGKKLIDQVLPKIKDGENSFLFFFPPGVGFPKTVAQLLNHRIQGLNPFAGLNTPLTIKFPSIMKSFGKVSKVFMDLLGMGISYSSVWPVLEQFYQNNLSFAGSFGIDPFHLKKVYQFENYNLHVDAMVTALLTSPYLKFGNSLGIGATFSEESEIQLQEYIPGGFVTKADNTWGKDAFLKITKIEEPLYETHTKSSVYFDLYHPLCVKGVNSDEIALYIIAANPNLRPLLITIPDQVLESLTQNPSGSKAFLGHQSASQIRNFIQDALKDALTRGKIKNPAFGIFFECANRAMALGDHFKNLLEEYKEFFGDIPFLGVLAGGEIISRPVPVVNCSVVSMLAGT